MFMPGIKLSYFIVSAARRGGPPADCVGSPQWIPVLLAAREDAAGWLTGAHSKNIIGLAGSTPPSIAHRDTGICIQYRSVFILLTG